jgi:chemotaxis signal transduction protein
MIRFRTSGGAYAVPIEHAVAVRGAGEVRALPSPADGVAGVLAHADGTVPVLTALGAGSGHVLLVADADGRAVGVQTEEVTGLEEVAADAVGPAPAGQEHALVTAVARFRGDAAFVVDVGALARSVPTTAPRVAPPQED